MRLYSGQIGIISSDVIRALVDASLIEVDPESAEEAELDCASVLKEYVRVDRDLGRRARELTIGDGAGAEQKMKRQLAKEKNFKAGDDGLEYMVNQIIETFMHSNNIAEVFGSDRDLRAVITQVMKKHTRDRSDELDIEVRSKLKNLEEGSSAWEIEYQKAMAQVRRIKGIED